MRLLLIAFVLATLSSPAYAQLAVPTDAASPLEATVAAYLHDAPWAELGTPEGVLSAQRDALSGRLPIHPEILAMGGEATETNSIVHPTAQVDPAARLLRTTVGAGSVVEAGAHLTDVVVLPGGHAEAGVNLQGALLDTHREITDLQSAPA